MLTKKLHRMLMPVSASRSGFNRAICEFPTNVDGAVGHHVFVVVESMLKIGLMLSVTEESLQRSHTQLVYQSHREAAAALSVGLSPTTSNEQLCSCMQRDLSEVTKLKVRG